MTDLLEPAYHSRCGACFGPVPAADSVSVLLLRFCVLNGRNGYTGGSENTRIGSPNLSTTKLQALGVTMQPPEYVYTPNRIQTKPFLESK